MTGPEAKLEYWIGFDGEKFVAIDSDKETVGVYEEEAQADNSLVRSQIASSFSRAR